MNIQEYLNKIQNNFKIGKSKIQGNGVIATSDISKGSFINIALEPLDKPNGWRTLKATLFGAHLNHSYNPNAETKREKDRIYKTYAIKDIKSGDEITVDYTVNKDLEQPEKDWS